MIERYENPRIAEIWRLDTKFKLWQNVELAVIAAREKLGRIPAGTHESMKTVLEANIIDVGWIGRREKVLKHDLNAFLEERSRFLPEAFKIFWHQGMTSYDTEEAPFATMLKASCKIVIDDVGRMLDSLRALAIRYRYTPMNARTHGQEAEMQSFGKRCLTWYKDLEAALETLCHAGDTLIYSKLSGAIGTNSTIDPELEKTALAILELIPWHGATQIMPRVLYSPIAGALSDIAMVLDKVATDIRLGSRSGRPLWHEPFSRGQKGSSAMPHKKNPIASENTEGMATMAANYASGIKANIQTWEERDISQSSVERVFWPDLFHVTLHALKNMTGIASGLVVYPDNMMMEIIESRGTYASNSAKEFLTEHGLEFGISREDAYRIIQLACFDVFMPNTGSLDLRANPPKALGEADSQLRFLIASCRSDEIVSIQTIVDVGGLGPVPELEADQETVAGWNVKLEKLFFKPGLQSKWGDLFKPSHILANEAHLFKDAFNE